MKALFPLLFLAWCAPLAAQQAAIPDADELPAVDTRAQPQVAEDGSGTVIVGDRESPIGLYILPWRESAAEEGIDRPAQLLQEKLTAIDEAVFIRNIEYYGALSGALKKKQQVTPAP